MSRDTHDQHRSFEEVCADIVKQLRVRGPEIEQAIFIYLRNAVPDPVGDNDPEYAAGLSTAVSAGIDYSLMAIEHGEKWSGLVPSAIIEQARRAARSDVSLETVMRRVTVAERLVKKFATDEADHLSARVLDEALSPLGTAIDRLTAVLADEYSQEREQMERLPEQHRSEIVQRLLSSESVDSTELAELEYEIYTFWHLGLIATGTQAADILQRLKAHYPRLLAVSPKGCVWAWLGFQEMPTVRDIKRLSIDGHVGLSLAVGEPGKGIDGWRLTHEQAQAALRLALYKPDGFARYADDRLLATTLQNDTLIKSLTQKYLVPLRGQKDGGAALRQTLRTYIDLDCNASSAAHALRVGRHTVESRVRSAEKLIGCSLRGCLTELDVALRLEELDRTVAPDASG
jgi:DNA-binding PucR family transcriptional regulator